MQVKINKQLILEASKFEQMRMGEYKKAQIDANTIKTPYKIKSVPNKKEDAYDKDPISFGRDVVASSILKIDSPNLKDYKKDYKKPYDHSTTEIKVKTLKVDPKTTPERIQIDKVDNKNINKRSKNDIMNSKFKVQGGAPGTGKKR